MCQLQLLWFKGTQRKPTITMTTLDMISARTCEFKSWHWRTVRFQKECLWNQIHVKNNSYSNKKAETFGFCLHVFVFYLLQCYQMRPGLVWSWRRQKKLQKLAHESKSCFLKIQGVWGAQKRFNLAFSSRSEDNTTGMLAHWTHYFKMELNYSFHFWW